jgi:hypothetical protein
VERFVVFVAAGTERRGGFIGLAAHGHGPRELTPLSRCQWAR